MSREPKPNSKRVVAIIVVLCVIFVASLIGTIVALKPSSSTLVEVVQDNKVLYTIDLSSAKDQNIDIEYNGSHNVVTIQDGEIFVSSADCNDKICVKTGILKSESLPIVCLPNHLIIRFKSED